MKGIRALANSLLISMFVMIVGCKGKHSASPADYLKYVGNEKSGLRQVKDIDNIKYEACYLPPEAMTLMELKDNMTKEKYTKALPEYAGLQYVRFNMKTISDGHIYNSVRHNDGEPEEIEDYLNLKAQQDFYMVAGNDTSKCVLYSFAKTYGLAYDWVLMLGFEKKDTTSDLYLKYNDNITGSGLLSFRYKRSDISNLPIIKLEP